MTTPLKAINGWDTKDGIALVFKKDGEKSLMHIKHVDWYFYILKSDHTAASSILKKYQHLIKSVTVGNQYVKINAIRETRIEPSIETLRSDLEKKGIEVFEFDLRKVKRYMIDKNIEIETKLDILYFDIETDDRHGGIVVGRDRILSWAACDRHGNTYYQTGDEKVLLQKFIDILDRYDVITGWNSGGFDLPYIQERCLKHNIDFDWRTVVHVDMMERCFKIYSYEANVIGLKNFSLNEISRAFLGKEKVDHEGTSIYEMFENQPEKLQVYNIQDAKLLVELDMKLGILDLMIQECSWTGAFLNRFYIGELLDSYILREAKKRKKILHSKPSEAQFIEIDKISVTGGFVAKPIKGLYKHVNICDFKSLYPSLIVGWNIGTDSLEFEKSKLGYENLLAFLGERDIEDVEFEEWTAFLKAQKEMLDPTDECIQTANNSYFRRSINSFIGDLVETLLNERAEYKKKLKVLQVDTPEYNNTFAAERVVKEMANSMFGITCEKRSRYFSRYVAEGITYTGQYMNKLSSYLAKTLEMTSIYGDTDSIFLVGSDDFEEGIVKLNDLLRSYLNAHVGLRKNIVSLEYEKHFSHLLLLEKKRYTGVLSMKDGKPCNKIFSRGTEDVKKGNMRITKEYFNTLTKHLFSDSFTPTKAMRFIEDIKQHIMNDTIAPKELILINRVSKQIKNYKTLSLHARLADRLIKAKKILPIVESEKRMGTRLEYIVVDHHGKNEGILLEEYTGIWNRQYYWDVQIYAPLRRLLECAYPDIDWGKYEIEEEQKRLATIEKAKVKQEKEIEKQKLKEEKEKIKLEKAAKKLKK